MSRVVKAQHPISPSEESVSGVRPYLLPGQSGSVECEKSGEVRVTRWVRVCGRGVWEESAGATATKQEAACEQ